MNFVKKFVRYNPFVKTYELHHSSSQWKNPLEVPLEEYPRFRSEILKLSPNTENPTLNVNRRLSFGDKHSGRRDSGAYNGGKHSSIEGYAKKRTRDSYDDGVEPKRQRINVQLVQYAIKEPSQYANPNRKILENLFYPEITADGWQKDDGGVQYHTQVRGQCYFEKSHSVESARELVAERALKELYNFKSEKIFWPDKLLSLRLNQRFADEIERMVKAKFDEIMERDLQYKTHKVCAAIVMTTEGMSSKHAKVVAIATGTKCISNINEDQDGNVLHDMHAEVLARRSFVRYLGDQLNMMAKKKSSIFQPKGKEIQLKDGLKFHLYVNAIPCGDARVFSLKGLVHVKNEANMGSLRIKKIGLTKPISENSFRVSSMSCSDKILRWNVLGLQGSHLAKFIKPIYLESIVLGSSYTPIHLYRAIVGRLDDTLTDLPNDYVVNKPKFESTSLMETDNSVATSYGVCWSDGYGDENAPEILNLHTGLRISGNKSLISKRSITSMFKSIDRKLPVRCEKGVAKYATAKEKFYTALKKENFGAWEKGSGSLVN